MSYTEVPFSPSVGNSGSTGDLAAQMENVINNKLGEGLTFVCHTTSGV